MQSINHLISIGCYARLMRAAFTLLELSIVLVIIGLIVGGITAGKEMIRNAELSSVIHDVERYRAAIYAFRYKYGDLPGDLANASSFWPACDATPSNCNANPYDGYMDWGRSWLHLRLAGLVSGNYPFLAPATPKTPGVALPASALEPSAYVAAYGLFYGKTFNLIGLTAITSSNGFWSGVMPSDQARSIEGKIDDGHPSYGKLFVINHHDGTAYTTSGCLNGGDRYASPSAISWNLSNSSVANCALVFLMD